MSLEALIQSAPKKADLRNSLCMDLHVISPIHIGTREGRLGATEFVAGGGKVYLIDEDRLGRFLVSKNLVDAFVLEVRKGPFQMAQFLQKNAKLRIPEDLHMVCSMSIPGGDPSMQDFRPFTRDGSGAIYIPGTSLKGVFRTAILYRLLNQDLEFRKSSNSRIGQDPEGEINKRRKFYSEQWLQKEHLESFDLPGGKKGSPNVDILRCLTVRDAYPVGPVRTQVVPIKFLSRLSDGTFYWSQDKKHFKDKDLSIWVECVTEGTFRLEMLWAADLYKAFMSHNKGVAFPVSNLQDVLDAVREMNEALVKHELAFYGSATGGGNSDAPGAAKALLEWYKTLGNQTLRIGFGSGMLSTTVGLALEESVRQKIRDACGSGRRPGDPAPKSRRVWRRTESITLPMGWLKLAKADPKLGPIPPDLSSLSREIGKPTEQTGHPDAQREGRTQELPPVERVKVAPSKEVWEQAEIRWDRGKDEVAALREGKKAICRGNDLDEDSRQFMQQQKKGKPFKARVVVEVLSDSYRKILKLEPTE